MILQVGDIVALEKTLRGKVVSSEQDPRGMMVRIEWEDYTRPSRIMADRDHPDAKHRIVVVQPATVCEND